MMRKTILALLLSGLVGGSLIEQLQAAPRPHSQAQATRGKAVGYRPLTVQRTIARPQRATTRPSIPPRGATLVRGRYWDPQLRWKTDRATRSVYAVNRGEVWFMEPSTGWAYTIDRYGRVYTADPRYRAVYSMGSVARWRGKIPYFFGYFAPDDGYYSLPRYRNFTTYYRNDRYDWYDYDDAYDHWWDSYDDYFESPRFRPTVSFSFFDDRTVRYDRYYTRDVYIDQRGSYYVEPPPYRGGNGFGVPGYGRGDNGIPRGGWGNRFVRDDDARLPIYNPESVTYRVPPPQAAVQIINRQPPVTLVNIAPAVTVNVAAVAANNSAVRTAIPDERQIVAIERSIPAPQPAALSSFDSVPMVDTAVIEEPLPVVAIDTSFDPKAGLSADELDGSIDVSTPEIEALVEETQAQIDTGAFDAELAADEAAGDTEPELGQDMADPSEALEAAADEGEAEAEAEAEADVADEFEAVEISTDDSASEAETESEEDVDDAAEVLEEVESDAEEIVEESDAGDAATEETAADLGEDSEALEEAADDADTVEDIDEGEGIDEAVDAPEEVEAADEDSEPVEDVAEDSEPVEEFAEDSEPVEEVAEEPEPVEEFAEEPEPVEEEVAEEPEPVEEVAEEPEPVEEVAEEPEPVEEVAEEPEPVEEVTEEPAYEDTGDASEEVER